MNHGNLEVSKPMDRKSLKPNESRKSGSFKTYGYIYMHIYIYIYVIMYVRLAMSIYTHMYSLCSLSIFDFEWVVQRFILVDLCTMYMETFTI